MRTHSFSVEAAQAIGIDAAVILGHMAYICEENKSNGVHHHDGMWWMRATAKSLCNSHPYIGERRMRTILTRLEEQGYVVSSEYNERLFDRTKWYAVTEAGYALTYGNQTEVQAVPKKPKPKKEKPFVPPTREEVRAYVREKGYHFDPDQLYDYYEASDWTLSNGKRATRWRQCCVTWEGNSGAKANKSIVDKYAEYG